MENIIPKTNDKVNKKKLSLNSPAYQNFGKPLPKALF